jgi:hypothetical protein
MVADKNSELIIVVEVIILHCFSDKTFFFGAQAK